jgi:hypothetical protein
MSWWKAVTPVKTGVQRINKYLKGLGSGFRRNDRKTYSSTFHGIIIFLTVDHFLFSLLVWE